MHVSIVGLGGLGHVKVHACVGKTNVHKDHRVLSSRVYVVVSTLGYNFKKDA